MVGIEIKEQWDYRCYFCLSLRIPHSLGVVFISKGVEYF